MTDVQMLKCPKCGSDDSFTSWEQTMTGYSGVRFFIAPDGSGRDVDYDGTHDYEAADDGGGIFSNDITCTNCDTLGLTIESLLDDDGKPAEPVPAVLSSEAAIEQIFAVLDGREWSGADDLDSIAEIVTRTGRVIREPIETD